MRRLLQLCAASSVGLLAGMVIRREADDLSWIYRYIHARGDVE